MKTLFRLSVLAIALLSMAVTLFSFEADAFLFLASAAALVSGFASMSGSFRRISILFLLLGIGLMAYSRQPPAVWLRSAGSMTSIIAIITVMQVFSVPIRVGSYDDAIRAWLGTRFKTRTAIFMMTTVTTHILTSFLNIGAIPVMVSLFKQALKGRFLDWQRFFSNALTRGFVLAALWSPGAINIYLIVQATGLSWSKVFIPGVIMAVLGMGLSTLMEMGGEGRAPAAGPAPEYTPGHVPAAVTGPEVATGSAPEAAAGPAAEVASASVDQVSQQTPTGRSADGKRVFHVLLVALIFIVAVAFLDRTGLGTAAGRSVIAGAAIAIAWTLTLRRLPGIGASLREYWEIGTSKVADIAPFFVAMGVFSTGIEESGFLAIAGPILQTIAGHLGGASVILIALLIIVMSLVGLHPFITIVLFGKILAHAAIPLPPLTIALAITSGSLTAYMLTPFAGVIMAIARSLEVRAIDVALYWNWRFCALFFAMTIAFAFAWGACFG